MRSAVALLAVATFWGICGTTMATGDAQTAKLTTERVSPAQIQRASYTARLLIDQAQMAIRSFSDMPGDRFSETRMRWTTLCLKALAVLLDAGVPAERVTTPAWTVESGPGSRLTTDTEREARRHDEAVREAEWHRVQMLNFTVSLRKLLLRGLPPSCVDPPYPTEEYARLAAAVLGDPDAAAEFAARAAAAKAEATTHGPEPPDQAPASSPAQAPPADLVQLRMAVRRVSPATCEACLHYVNADAQHAVVARREYTVLNLRTLAVLLNAGLPPERPIPPKLTPRPAGLPLAGAEYAAWTRREDEEMAAFNRALLIDELVDYRNMLTDIIRDTYSPKPVATDELRQAATEITKDDKTVGSLVTSVEKVIADQARELAGATPPPPATPGESGTETAPPAK